MLICRTSADEQVTQCMSSNTDKPAVAQSDQYAATEWRALTMKPVLLRTGSLDARRLKVSMASMPRSVGRLAKASHMFTCRSSLESKPCSKRTEDQLETYAHFTSAATTSACNDVMEVKRIPHTYPVNEVCQAVPDRLVHSVQV